MRRPAFQVVPEEVGSGQVMLYRVSPDDSTELLRLLSGYEVHITSAERMQTGGAIYDIVTVSVAAGGAVTALVHVLHKFLDLRREKSIHIETDNGLKVITKGASIDEVERAVRVVSEYALGERDDTDRLRVLGPDHPDTLNTRHNLAYWRGEAGDLTGAATATEQLLTDRLRVLGPDHPDTLSTRHNLAYWRSKAEDQMGLY